MGRRGLGDASAMAKMWGFVALTLGALSFIQAHAYVPRDSTRATELPVEACALAVPEEYKLESLQPGFRARIEHLTGLPRVDLSARPISLSSSTRGVILQTESRREFRLARQKVNFQGQPYFPLIARALEALGQSAPGSEAYVVHISEQDVSKLKELVRKSRGYCAYQRGRPVEATSSDGTPTSPYSM